MSANELAALSRRKQLAFGLLLVERMLPLLAAFGKRTGFAYEVHLRARDEVWTLLAERVERNDAKTSARSLRAACLKAVPDTEQYSEVLASYALNAALSMIALLEFVMHGRLKNLIEIVDLARGSIDMCFAASYDLRFSNPRTERLDANPLLIEEYRRQAQDLEFLDKQPDTIEIAALKRRVNEQDTLVPMKAYTRK